MVRAIYESDYKTAVYIEVIPTEEPERPSNPNAFYDSLLFSKPSNRERAPIRRRVEEVDELTRYLESDVLHQATDVLKWWKVSKSFEPFQSLFWYLLAF